MWVWLWVCAWTFRPTLCLQVFSASFSLLSSHTICRTGAQGVPQRTRTGWGGEGWKGWGNMGTRLGQGFTPACCLPRMCLAASVHSCLHRQWSAQAAVLDDALAEEEAEEAKAGLVFASGGCQYPCPNTHSSSLSILVPASSIDLCWLSRCYCCLRLEFCRLPGGGGAHHASSVLCVALCTLFVMACVVQPSLPCFGFCV